VVPRREYEALKTAHDSLVLNHEEMQADYVKNKAELTYVLIWY
jgi:hypothetical protein